MYMIWEFLFLGEYQTTKCHAFLSQGFTCVIKKTKRRGLHFYKYLITSTWWRHQMETFSALLAICAGNSPVPGEFPAQSPVTRSFDVFFDLRLNKRLSKQSWGWWFETLSCPLWLHCNEYPKMWELLCQKEVSKTRISNCISQYQWHIISYPCPRYLLLVHKFSYVRCSMGMRKTMCIFLLAEYKCQELTIK